MAIFHLSTTTISRKSGRTSVAAAAYRAGVTLHDQRTNKTHNYEVKGKNNVVFKECFMCVDGQKIELDRASLWNKAEQSEKRADARTAREIIINLPHELDPQQRKNLVAEFSEQLAKKYQIAIDYAIHLPNEKGDDRNHHAHILMTTREAALNGDSFFLGEKTSLELSNTKLQKLGLPRTQDQIKTIRESWAELTNLHLKNAGIDETIDHRSYADQDSDQIATKKIGVKATQMERRGVKTEKGEHNRIVKQYNQVLKDLIYYEAEREQQNITANTSQINSINQDIDESKRATFRTEQAIEIAESEVRIESDRYDSTEQSIKHRERKFSELASRYASTERAISNAIKHQPIANQNHHPNPKMAAPVHKLFAFGVATDERDHKSIISFNNLYENLKRGIHKGGASLRFLNPSTQRMQDVNNFEMNTTYKRVFDVVLSKKFNTDNSPFADYNTMSVAEFFTKYNIDSTSENAQKDIAERYSKIAPDQPQQKTTQLEQQQGQSIKSKFKL